MVLRARSSEVKMGDGIVRRKAIFESGILSSRHGGEARVTSYCLYFQERPATLRSSLCLGCQDRERCVGGRGSASTKERSLR